MGTIGVIQARMGSSRLPGKILAPLAGLPMLEVLTRRLAGGRVDEWCLATSWERADDLTESWGHALGLRVYRGDPEDVLSRFTGIVRELEPEWVVRVTADDPFVDAALVDRLLAARDTSAKDADLVSLGHASGLPLGYGVQLSRAEALLAAESSIPDDARHHRSHVTTWLAARPGRCVEAASPEGWPARPDWRWTVDTWDDLAMARSAFELFGLAASRVGYPEMVRLLDARPEITAMNTHVRQKDVSEG